jgi:hypothetical protein
MSSDGQRRLCVFRANDHVRAPLSSKPPSPGERGLGPGHFAEAYIGV